MKLEIINLMNINLTYINFNFNLRNLFLKKDFKQKCYHNYDNIQMMELL